MFWINLITVRKRSLRRLCFHRCLSVHGGRRGVCLPWVGTHPPGKYTPLSRYTPRAGIPPGLVHPPGRHPPAQCVLGYTHPPAQCMLGYTDNGSNVCDWITWNTMEITQRKSIKHAKSNKSNSYFRKPLISGSEGNFNCFWLFSEILTKKVAPPGGCPQQSFLQTPFKFFAFTTNLPEIAMLASKDFTAAKGGTSSGAGPDDQWIKSLMLIHLS